MNEIMKLCGIALTALIVILVLKQYKSEMAQMVTLVCCAVIMGSVLAMMTPAVDYINSLAGTNEYSGCIQILIKALAVTITAATASDICRDAGENAIASKLESACKIELIILGLPLMKDIISLINEILL